jgi:hypothetical protein
MACMTIINDKEAYEKHQKAFYQTPTWYTAESSARTQRIWPFSLRIYPICSCIVRYKYTGENVAIVSNIDKDRYNTR